MKKQFKQGRLAVNIDHGGVAVAALKCQTDFLANSDLMKETLHEMCVLLSQDDCFDKITSLLAKLSEKAKEDIMIYDTNFFVYEDNLTTAYYIHHDHRKIGVVQIKSEKKCPEIKTLCRDIAMHIVAFDPEATTMDEIDWTDVDLSLPEDIMKNKPENILENIRKGKKKKYAKQHALMDQPFVKDMTKSVSEIIVDYEKSWDTKIEIDNWDRIEV